MEFRDQPHDVQPQAEMRLVVMALALLEQGLEQPAEHGLGNRRAVVRDAELVVAAGLRARRTRDEAGRRTEIHRILDELVEHLHDQIGRTAHEAGIGGRIEVESRAGKGVPIAGDGGRAAARADRN